MKTFQQSRSRRSVVGKPTHANANRAAYLSANLAARAFTVASDPYFGPGEYRPDNASGRRLIAHELTHVLQQRGTELRPQREANTLLSLPVKFTW